jgi:hypothetical protein
MTRFSRTGLLVALVTLVAPFGATANHAPATLGRANAPGEASCWTSYFTALSNGCSSMRRLILPLVTETIGTKWVTVTAQGATPASTVGCLAYGVNYNVTAISTSGPLRFLTVFGTQSQDLWLGGIDVPEGGSAFAHCEVSPGGRVNHYHWSP